MRFDDFLFKTTFRWVGYVLRTLDLESTLAYKCGMANDSFDEIENGSTKYPSQFKSYFRGENKDTINWNTQVVMIYINNYCLYVHNKETLFSILSNLQTYLENICQSCTDLQGAIGNPRHQTPQGKPVTKPEAPLQNILVGNANPIQGSSMAMSSRRRS